jgi:hypothetical protein
MTKSNSQQNDLPLDTVITALGWFSIGLGVAELIAHRQVNAVSGMKAQTGVLRGYGLREIATGIGILTSENPRPWLWGRVAGDVLDVATVAATADTRRQGRLGASFAALLSVGLLDLYAAWRSVPKRARYLTSRYSDQYRVRSGFPRTISEMRGAALKRSQRNQPQSVRAAS